MRLKNNKGRVFSFYISPFASKEIDVPVGANEINCVYFKGVNEQYNLLGNEWSDCVSFITNELVNEGGDTLKNYYQKYVADFGAEWISFAKEKKVPAYSGLFLFATFFVVFFILKFISFIYKARGADLRYRRFPTLRQALLCPCDHMRQEPCK